MYAMCGRRRRAPRLGRAAGPVDLEAGDIEWIGEGIRVGRLGLGDVTQVKASRGLRWACSGLDG